MHYWAASGEPIFNEGEREVRCRTLDGFERTLVFHVCDVTKPLGRVSRICSKGNRVVLDEEGSYIMQKATGHKVPLVQRDGVYVLEAWVWKKKKQLFKGGDRGREPKATGARDPTRKSMH